MNGNSNALNLTLLVTLRGFGWHKMSHFFNEGVGRSARFIGL